MGMMVGSAVSDAAGIYGDGLTNQECITRYGSRVRRIIASYRADELTAHVPDDHRANYDVSSFRSPRAETLAQRMICRETAHVPRRRLPPERAA